MNKKYLIHVHEKGERYLKPGKHVEDINRVLRAEMIGNFNPIFCTYLKTKHLVNSTFGDLSDPFRRTEDYSSYLFIEIGA